MAKYTVIIIPAARRDIKKLDKRIQKLTYEALKYLKMIRALTAPNSFTAN